MYWDNSDQMIFSHYDNTFVFLYSLYIKEVGILKSVIDIV